MQPRFADCLTAALWLGAATLADAQPYPDKPVRLVVPYPAGTATDIFARQISPKVAEFFGQAIVIENRGGGAAIVGTDAVAKSLPDGYTFMLATSQTHAVNKSLFPQLPYDPVTSFAPVARLATQVMVLVVNAAVPARTVAELVAHAKANPRALNFASTGSGTSAHLSGALFNKEVGLDITHVPYKSAAQALADLVGGQVTMMFYPYLAVQPFMQAGRIVPLGTTGPQRSSYLPNVPTMTEAGYPNVVVTVWFAVYAPAGTPRRMVDLMAAALGKTVSDPDIRRAFAATGTDASYIGPDELAAFTRSEIERYKKIVEVSGAKAE